MPAVAYLNYGRWVADCPSPKCKNALALSPGQATWKCSFVANGQTGRVDGCQKTDTVKWPNNLSTIVSSVASLPESLRNWRPS